MNDELIEILAEIEHNQWMEWSKALVTNEKRLSFARIERWKKLWKPYKELSEEEREQDRVYARKVLDALRGFTLEFPPQKINILERGK